MIDVISPINAAYERTQKILFPFNVERWVPIAFGAFLMCPVLGGPPDDGENHTYSPELLTAYSIIALFGAAFSIFLMWLNACGRFMFLDNIIQDKPSISEPWNKYLSQATLLFLFNFVLGLVAVIYIFVGAIPFVVIAYLQPSPILFTAYSLVLCLVSLPFCTVFLSFYFFGPPIMYKQGISPWAAFQITTSFLRKDPVGLFAFLLVMMGLGFAYGVALIICAICTFCIFCLLFIIPFLSNLIVLPATVFFQCYTLEVLAQFGPEYDLWNKDSGHSRY